MHDESHNQGRATGHPLPGRPSSSPRATATLLALLGLGLIALARPLVFSDATAVPPERAMRDRSEAPTGVIAVDPATASADRASVDPTPRDCAEAEPESSPTAYLSGIVTDAVGRPLADARITAIVVGSDECPAAHYLETTVADLDATEGVRGRSRADGTFALFGATPGVEYELFVDLQGEDVWWIDECATPVARSVAPASDLRLGLPYGIVTVSVRLPQDLEALRSAGSALDVRLRIRREPDDERVVGAVENPIRVAVAFDSPLQIVAEGIGLRERTIRDVVVSQWVGSLDLPFELEGTGLAHRLDVIVANAEGLPVPDTWVYELSEFDPPRFETLRTSSCSARDEGIFVFEFLEARDHAIVAIPDADTGLAPSGGYVTLEPSSSRELQLTLGAGEFVEVRVPARGESISVVSITCPDLDFDVGQLVEWVEVGHGSWERVKTFAPGKTYRSTFRLPLGRADLHYAIAGVELSERIDVAPGFRARVQLGADR